MDARLSKSDVPKLYKDNAAFFSVVAGILYFKQYRCLFLFFLLFLPSIFSYFHREVLRLRQMSTFLRPSCGREGSMGRWKRETNQQSPPLPFTFRFIISSTFLFFFHFPVNLFPRCTPLRTSIIHYFLCGMGKSSNLISRINNELARSWCRVRHSIRYIYKHRSARWRKLWWRH